MQERPHDLPNGREVADALSELYKLAMYKRNVLSPENIAIYNGSAGQPVEKPPYSERVQQLIGSCIEGFVSTMDEGRYRKLGPANAADEIQMSFGAWKPAVVEHLKANARPQDEVDAVSSLSLNDMATYSESQFAGYRRIVESSRPGEKLDEAKRKRNKWGFAVEFLRPAAELEKKGNTQAEELLRVKIGQHMESYINGLDTNLIKEHGINDAVRITREQFERWKKERILAFEKHERPQEEIDAIKNISLQDMADYAQAKSEEFSKIAQSHALGSHEYTEAAKQCNRWTEKAELLYPAARLEK